jgi:hypothetical protein
MAPFKNEFVAVLVGGSVLLPLCGCNSTTAANTAEAVPTGRFAGGLALVPKETLAALTPNVTAARVIELLGRPERIKPMDAANVRAEVWVYRISRRETVAQVEIGQKEVSLGSQTLTPVAPAAVPIYRNETTRVYQTIELLIVNDRLAVQKPGRPEVEITYM